MTVQARNNGERFSAAWSLFCSCEQEDRDIVAIRAEYDVADLLVGMLFVASYLRSELRRRAAGSPHAGTGTDAWLERERLRNAERDALGYW